MHFGKTKENSKFAKANSKSKVSLELLHQILGHRSTRSLLDEDTVNIWKEIDIKVDTEPFFTSCQISTINKNPISKTPLKPNTPLKWVFMDIIPAISSKILTKDTTFSNYLFIVDAFSKLPKVYGMKISLLRK